MSWTPFVSLLNLMEELIAYGQVSNFQINYAKSEILPTDVPPALATTLESFHIYLGFHLHKNIWAFNLPTV